MRTLDEVIAILAEGIADVEAYDAVDDALYYLREYHDNYSNLITSMNHHLRKIKEFEQNDPLTWDELKQMGGKAVWIEGTHHKHWCIIKGIARKDLSEMEYITLAYLNNKNRIVTYDRRKGNFDVTWQAYRKERANENLG